MPEENHESLADKLPTLESVRDTPADQLPPMVTSSDGRLMDLRVRTVNTRDGQAQPLRYYGYFDDEAEVEGMAENNEEGES